jgi:hypothetical protein
MKADEALAQALADTGSSFGISNQQRALLILENMKAQGVHVIAPDDLRIEPGTPLIMMPEPPTLRDFIAIDAPIDYEVVKTAYGTSIPSNDIDRAAFFAAWALLRYEFADAMLDQKKA